MKMKSHEKNDDHIEGAGAFIFAKILRGHPVNAPKRGMILYCDACGVDVRFNTYEVC